jgi:uncharacterized protein (DUF1015 family)
MAAIQAFRAIRYQTRSGDDLSSRIAPPYDVLDKAGKEELLRRDPANFVSIDLPHVPAKEAGPPEVYAAAARKLEGWLADGTMLRDETPALYVYHQRYTHGGAAYTRKMFFARLRLEEFGAGSVFPHEQTFGGPKEDRFLLTQATRANLSPIFGLYEDPTNEISRRLESAIGPTPVAEGTLEGVESTVWAVRDAAVIADIVRTMASKPIYIADGHHRYGTGLNYRRSLAAAGGLSEDHPANFILCVFVAMEDPGALILPTHRVLPGAAVSIDAFKSDERFNVQAIDGRDPETVPAALARFGPQTVAFFAPGGGFHALTPKNTDFLAEFDTTHSPAWRRLALAVLHAYLLEKRVAALSGGKTPEIHYVKAATAAVDEARHTGGCAFLMQPTTMQEMRDVCKAGDLMPQKSTYFYPKLASGLIVNPLE